MATIFAKIIQGKVKINNAYLNNKVSRFTLKLNFTFYFRWQDKQNTSRSFNIVSLKHKEMKAYFITQELKTQ